MGSADEPSFGVLAGALAELDRRRAEAILIAVRSYVAAERRLIEIDERAGQNVEYEAARLARLEAFGVTLKAKLGSSPEPRKNRTAAASTRGEPGAVAGRLGHGGGRDAPGR